MKKTECQKIQLGKGTIFIYDFGNVSMQVYRTNDFIDDEAIMLIKNGKMAIIESPCFYENIKELEEYICSQNVTVDGLILAYHMGGGTFLPDAKKYVTKKANTFGTIGGGKNLVVGFGKAFGRKIFDDSIHKATNIIPGDKIILADMEFNLVETNDAFDIVIPEINVIYTHMLGHDCHSIIAGPDNAKKMIQDLEDYIQKGYELVLTSHYDPEDLDDVRVKIDYLNKILEIASKSSSQKEFKDAVNEKYSNYSGMNYLDITAGIFFTE